MIQILNQELKKNLGIIILQRIIALKSCYQLFKGKKRDRLPNNLMMQFQADLLRVPVVRPKVLETTALGVAYLAGLAVGYWDTRDEISRKWHADKTFKPTMPVAQAEALRKKWRSALERSRAWVDG